MSQKKQWRSERQRRMWAAIVDDYYAHPAVRARIREFLGTPVETISAVYISANDDTQNYRTAPLNPHELERCLDERKEIYRSLWDRAFLFAHLDVEYVNFDHPLEPYQKFEESYAFQKPLVQEIQKQLDDAGISAQHILSGRGHHFAWTVRRDSVACLELAQLGRVPSSLLSKYSNPLMPVRESIGLPLAQAFSGLGLVLEFLAHKVLRQSSTRCEVPVAITSVETTSARSVRECVTIDLSEYGDPLHTRSVRVPYSVNYKPLQQEHLGRHALNQIPPLFLLPVNGLEEQKALRVMRDAEEAAKMARRVGAKIPEQSIGTAALLRRYRKSRLAKVHKWFYSAEHDAPERWSQTYDATNLDMLPLSAGKILEHPNDLLLKPACLRHIVRVFLALGWHPRHIAGLIRSRYERDFGWGEEWFRYDAATRADFYCRVFTGLLLNGLDDLSDFACPPIERLCEMMKSTEENLDPFKQSLKRRMTHDRLAGRPFHGLFL